MFPQPDDQLFRDVADGSEAVIAGVRRSYVAIAHAYWEAAENIVRNWTSASGLSKAFQVVPLAFLYRHYVELTLKAIIKEGDEILGTSRLAHGHNLHTLWGHARTVINDAEVDLDPDALRSAERLLEELHTLDPHPGTAFRYFDPDRIPDSWYSVSIDNLSGVMRRWRNLFEEILAQLYHIERPDLSDYV